MNFKNKNGINEKMKVLYDELYNPYPNSKKQKLKSIFIKEDKLDYFNELNKLYSTPVNVNKPKKTILTLIEESKRKNLDYKSFLKIEDYYEPNKKFKSSSNIKGVNKGLIFKSNSTKLKNALGSIKETIKTPRQMKNENLKKEILEEINNKWDNINPNFSTLNKSYKELETSLISSNKLMF